VKLELSETELGKFQNIQNALGHDDLEETLMILLRLGEAAISITSIEKPELFMFTRGNSPHGINREVECPDCKTKFIPLNTLDEGYKELSVRLA
jgi:hypothetical protein